VTKLSCVVVAAGLLAAGAANAAAGAHSLGIKLQDPSTDPSIEHMRIVIDRQTINAGSIAILVQNQSKNLVHEVLIARDDGAGELPLDANHDLVIESRVRPLGKIANIAPGKSGKLALTLEPGAYVLFCNLPGHYLDGMVARFTVLP